MAKPKKDEATVDETASVKEGDPFLASHVHVDRDGETVALPAGHFVSELKDLLGTNLTDAERTGLEQRQVLRPGTAEDVKAAEARHSASAATKLQRNQKTTRQQLKAKHDRALKDFDAGVATERRDLLAEHDSEREEMEKGLAHDMQSAAIPVERKPDSSTAPQGSGTGELGASTGFQPGAADVPGASSTAPSPEGTAHPDEGQV